jgi:hypothetical protein
VLAPFSAHGSSIRWSFVIDTLASDGAAVFGRFQIVAMAVHELQIDHPVIAAKALRDDVICFKQIAVSEVQSTPSALPLLDLEQGSDPAIQQGMFFQSLCEVGSDCHRRDWPRL